MSEPSGEVTLAHGSVAPRMSSLRGLLDGGPCVDGQAVTRVAASWVGMGWFKRLSAVSPKNQRLTLRAVQDSGQSIARVERARSTASMSCRGKTGSLISTESPIASLSRFRSELVPSTTNAGELLALRVARISRLSVN